MGLSTTLEVFIFALTAFSVGMVIYNKRKSGSNDIPWKEIYPIFIKAFNEIDKIEKAEQLGYQALEDYAVLFIRHKIVTSKLDQHVKDFLTDEKIRELIAPRLLNIYQERKK